MTQTLEHLRQSVRDIASTVDSAITFIDGIVERLHVALASEDTDSEVEQLANELEDAKLKLASAVAANTASEDDSAEQEADHGPIDNSATAPGDGTPATDSTQQPEGGEPAPLDDTVGEGDPVEEVQSDTPPDSQASSDGLVVQAPSEDTPGDVDRVPADEAPTATVGNPDEPAADDTAGQVSQQ